MRKNASKNLLDISFLETIQNASKNLDISFFKKQFKTATKGFSRCLRIFFTACVVHEKRLLLFLDFCFVLCMKSDHYKINTISLFGGICFQAIQLRVV